MNIKKNIYTLYIHISPSNKIYIGITRQNPINKRWKNGNGYKGNAYFYRAIQKYGWNKFEHEIFSNNLTKEEACSMEKKLILLTKSNDYNFGYNITSGGEGVCGMFGSKNPSYGKKVSEETRRKISDTKIKNKTHHTDEWKKRNSEIFKELWKTEEYRNKMSGKNSPSYGRVGDKHPLYGKVGENSACSKKVICLNTKEIFNSATIASKTLGVNHSKLCMCCRGERNNCGMDSNGNKLKWMYYKDYLILLKEI